MTDWEQRLKAAEAGAEQIQAAEEAAEQRFRTLQAAAETGGDPLQSDEFHSWMATRRATDAAWGEWATLMDARPAN